MVAQLLQDVDRFQRLRTGPSEELLDLGGGDEQPIKGGLGLAQTTEDDVFVFDRD